VEKHGLSVAFVKDTMRVAVPPEALAGSWRRLEAVLLHPHRLQRATRAQIQASILGFDSRLRF
jgi:hypothetical protein